MKTQKRKLLNQPIRSPSPDIANRSIITNTKSPANDVKDFLRMRQSSNSPKSLTSSFHQISKMGLNQNEQIKRLKRIIQDLQQKNYHLEKFKINNEELLRKIQSQNMQIANLKQQLIRKQRSISSNQYDTPRLSPNPRLVNPSPKAGNMPNFGSVIMTQKPSTASENQVHIPQVYLPPPNGLDNNILRQFNERIMKMSEENKRLCKKLKQIKDQKDILQMENMKLRDQSEENGKSRSFGNIPAGNNNNLQNLRIFFAEESDRLVKTHQRMAENKLGQINSRINRVQDTLCKLQKPTQFKSLNRQNSPFDYKTNVSTVTRYHQPESNQQHPLYGVDIIESKYTSPREIGAFTIQASPIRGLQEDKNRMKNQNDRLSRRINQLESELKKTLMTLNDTERRLKALSSQQTQAQSSSLSKFYQEKADSLQSQIQTKLSELKFKQLTIQELQKRLEDSKRFIEKQMPNYEKIIRQQKEKAALYRDQNEKNLQKVKYLQQTCNKNNRDLDELRLEIEEIRYSYDGHKYNFQKYLEMVLQIKYSLTGQNVNLELNEVERKWDGFDELQTEIMNIKEAYENLIQNFKKIILEKEKRVVELEKDNGLLSETVRFMNIEREKLQNAIYEYTSPIRTQLSEEEVRRKISHHQSASKARQPCQIRDYMNKTVHKISELERQIDSTIRNYQNERSIVREQKEKVYFNIGSSGGAQNALNKNRKLEDSSRATIKNGQTHKVINLLPHTTSSPASLSNPKLNTPQQGSQITKTTNIYQQQQNNDDSSLLEDEDNHLHQQE